MSTQSEVLTNQGWIERKKEELKTSVEENEKK